MTADGTGIKMGDLLWQLLLSLEKIFPNEGALLLKYFQGKLIEMLGQRRQTFRQS